MNHPGRPRPLARLVHQQHIARLVYRPLVQQLACVPALHHAHRLRVAVGRGRQREQVGVGTPGGDGGGVLPRGARPAQPAHWPDLRPGRPQHDHHLHWERQHLTKRLEQPLPPRTGRPAGSGRYSVAALDFEDGEAVLVGREAHADDVALLQAPDGLRLHLLRVVELLGALLGVVADAAVG
eukprot:scaffold9726_cov119-Isochrysis_galbana.AAC.17